MAHPGWRRHTKVGKWVPVAWKRLGVICAAPPPPLDSGPVSRYGACFCRKDEVGRRVDVGGGIAVGDLSRDVSAWIPAFAGMTNGGSLAHSKAV